jgi:glyoxylase-like metal-dependent hydrolase (beta-lactamase superfamily II)
MKQIRIGDVTIDAVIEREGPWRRPQDFFRDYDDAVFKHHLKTMEPEVFNAELGMLVMPYQTFVVRSPRYTILVDTCTGENKGHPAPFDFPGKERWRNELFALGISYDKVDYVFCTHLHIDHTGWNTTLRDGRWVPTFPNAKRAPIRPAPCFATIACRSWKPARRCSLTTTTPSTISSR